MHKRRFGFYVLILASHGEFRPFTNIAASELTHIAWLKDAFAQLGLALPEDRGKEHMVPAPTPKSAYEAGVKAEVDNIAMYDSFLASALLRRPENASLRALFTRLRDASKSHLAAFQNGLAKY